MQVILYGTSACHLCDKAEQLLWPQLVPGMSLRKIDIAESDELVDRYGVRIPVVVIAGRELDWPFAAEDLANFFSG